MSKNTKEIDLVEEQGGELFGFEVKWKTGRGKAPREWTSAYPGASFNIIHQENYIDFIQQILREERHDQYQINILIPVSDHYSCFNI